MPFASDQHPLDCHPPAQIKNEGLSGRGEGHTVRSREEVSLFAANRATMHTMLLQQVVYVILLCNIVVDVVLHCYRLLQLSSPSVYASSSVCNERHLQLCLAPVGVFSVSLALARSPELVVELHAEQLLTHVLMLFGVVSLTREKAK